MDETRSLIGVSLDLLHAIRAEVHGSVEDSVIERLDEAIKKLEEADENDARKYTALEILSMLGKVVELIPAIALLLEWLSKLPH
jgi:hypothetical protein